MSEPGGPGTGGQRAGALRALQVAAPWDSELRARPTDPAHYALEFVRELSPADRMLTGSAENYFHWGFTALDCVQLALRAGFHPPPRTVLDLPCGHGRVLRMLAAAFPNARLTACDLDADGVAFCARTFGATPVLSRAAPSEIELDGSFELIWVGSLLTHLDAAVWGEFLQLFSDHLEPAGVLVFTTHGRRSARALLDGGLSLVIGDLAELVAVYESEGFAYGEYADRPGLGISLSRPAGLRHRRRPPGAGARPLRRGWLERASGRGGLPQAQGRRR